MLEHEPLASVSTDFRALPNFQKCFYNSIEKQRTCFHFFWKTPQREKGKQLVNFDYESVNSLCSSPHYVTSCQVLVLTLHRVIET